MIGFRFSIVCRLLGLSAIALLFCFQNGRAQPWRVHEEMSVDQYQQTFDRMVSQGYRLTDLSAYDVNDQSRFASVWEKESGSAWKARHGMVSGTYQTIHQKMTSNGYDPVNVSGYVINGRARFAAQWEKGISANRRVRSGMTPEEYQTAVRQLKTEGYRPVDVSGYVINGHVRFAAIWTDETTTAWKAQHGLSSDAYQTTLDRMKANGYHPTAVTGYVVNGHTRYAGIWEKGSRIDRTTQFELTPQNYQGAHWNLAYRGYRPVQVAGYTVYDRTRMGGVWKDAHPSAGISAQDIADIRQEVQAFMTTHNVPGLSIAIAKEGRLVFAQGYGTAIRENNIQTRPHHRFRIASVSKPITSAAVMKLRDGGRLRLNQEVLGAGALLGTQFGLKPYGTNEKRVTVNHLLTHTAASGAWSRNNPMFRRDGLSQDELISWLLDSRSLSQAPGSTFQYSNFGYCLLGRVIESTSGQSYERYVKENVLKPSGIQRMAIAGNRRADRRSDEVVYYGQGGEQPYEHNVARMDAHGGWIASAVDLVRFGVHVDGFSTVPDFLPDSSVADMVTPSSVNNSYAKGWNVNNLDNWWHLGSLPGSASVLARIKNGEYVWAVLVNTRGTKKNFLSKLDQLPHRIKSTVSSWPSYDLFNYRPR